MKYQEWRKENGECCFLPEFNINALEVSSNAEIGILEKKGNTEVSRWKKRVVVVHHNMLYYYRSPQEMPRGVMCLDGCTVEFIESMSENSHSQKTLVDYLSFKVTSRVGRSLLFRASSETLRRHWVNVFRDAPYEMLQQRLKENNSSSSVIVALKRCREENALLKNELLALSKLCQSYESFVKTRNDFRNFEEYQSGRRSLDMIPSNFEKNWDESTVEMDFPLACSLDSYLGSNRVEEIEHTPVSSRQNRKISTNIKKNSIDEINLSSRNQHALTENITTSLMDLEQLHVEDDESAIHFPDYSYRSSSQKLHHIESKGIENKEGEMSGGRSRSYPDLNAIGTANALESDASEMLERRSCKENRNDLKTEVLESDSHDFSKLLVTEDMKLVSIILDIITRDEKISSTLPLLRIFGKEKKLFRLLCWGIDLEVETALSVNTLFRCDGVASRCLSMYTRAVGGNYIREVLTEPFRFICDADINDFELNPAKIDGPEKMVTVKKNASNLMNLCQRLLDSILASNIPKSFNYICKYLKSRVAQRFRDENTEEDSSILSAAVGSFFFLRFICPAITSPDTFDIISHSQITSCRRILVLITKLLFNIATGVEFGPKEGYMRPVNEFIIRNKPLIAKFYDMLVDTKHVDDVEVILASDSQGFLCEIPSTRYEEDLEMVKKLVKKYFEEIQNKLSPSSMELLNHLRPIICTVKVVPSSQEVSKLWSSWRKWKR